MKRRVGMVGAIWLAALVLLALLNATMPVARAAERPDRQDAAPAQNAVEWTVTSDVFESVYPGGFVVTLTASSPAGPIEHASLVWNPAAQRESYTLLAHRVPGEIDPVSGQIVASWQPDSTLMLPPWAVLAYHWELSDAAGNVLETDPIVAEYADNTRGWHFSESDDAIVYNEGLNDNVEPAVLNAITMQRDKYVAVWGDTLSYKPRILLFGDYSAWKEWRTEADPMEDNIVGQTFEEWGIIAQVLYGYDVAWGINDLVYSTVPHELEHLYQYEYLWPERTLYDVPYWFLEGDATFFEMEQSYSYLGNVRQIAVTRNLPQLLTTNWYDAPDPYTGDGRVVYDIAYSFLAWIEQEHGGLEAYRDMMARLATNEPFFDTLEAVTGMTVPEIEREWRMWVGAPGDLPTLVPTWTPAAPFLVTPTP
ncbi:hypothetical protein [Aggregatilinea lenta]|uniref:hypothetical protein n=1 Tax=Aggregatilinea lenta TaxID=913108 RepID=UPI0013C2D35E|nr:hypothetical protein [Aggregatilinea lenta]